MGAVLPSYRALPVAAGAPPGSSWGVWGEGDRFGALNLLDEAAARRGLAAARRGAVFSLNLDMELPGPPLYGRSAFVHEVRGGGVALDDEISNWNTQSSSQWDGFRHVRHLVHGYYGGLVGGDHGVDHWARRGIVGRGVLADVARWREACGRPLRCGEPDVIDPSDVAAVLDAEGVAVVPGDILVIRTGWLGWYRSLDEAGRQAQAAVRIGDSCGMRPGEKTAEFLWDLHVAAVAADNPALEVTPFGGLTDRQAMAAAFRDPERAPDTFLHFRLLALLGIPIGELWDLDSLATDCAADGVYEFLLTAAPLNLHAGVASPANALAVK
jgi:kynurenine formamidase